MSSLEATLNRVGRLAASGAAADVRALVDLLDDEDWQARRAAAEAIAQAVCAAPPHVTEAEWLFEELIAAVCDKAHAGRRAAATAALEGIGQLALPHLAVALQKANAATARIALAGVIGNAGGDEAVRLLAPLARDADTNVAAAAITALGRTRAPEAVGLLLEQTDEGDDWLRFAAVGALGELGDARAIEKLEQLLEESLMQEAAAASLVELATVEATRALARGLRASDGALRPAALAALVSLGRDERATPLAVAEAIRAVARRAFLEASDETTYSDLVRLMTTGEHGRAHVCLTALSWLGDARAVPLITRALDDSSLVKTARAALADLANVPQALGAMLASDLIPAELAAAIGNAQRLPAIEAAARLSVEARDAETLEASLSALMQGREWLKRQQPLAETSADDAVRLSKNLRKALQAAHGRALIEIAETLGALAPQLQPSTIEAITEQLSRTDAEDYVLARLALLQRANAGRAAAEAARAQRHPSATVRIAAIEILSRRAAAASAISLAQHLTDEAAGVRRATIRAMRHSAPTTEAERALLACLADEDIWVRAEAITTLGLLFGREPEARAQLREHLTAMHPLCRVAACDALAAHAEARDWQELARVARRDSQAEARRAAVQAFAHCTQPRTAFSVARHTLGDSEWPVRRASVEILASITEPAAHKLLRHVAGNQTEEAAVRGAALRALAKRDAPETIELSCLALQGSDTTLFEDAYAALLAAARTRRAEMQRTRATCAPRAANIINFILSDE